MMESAGPLTKIKSGHVACLPQLCLSHVFRELNVGLGFPLEKCDPRSIHVLAATASDMQ